MAVRSAAVAAADQWVDPDDGVQVVSRRCRSAGVRRDDRGWTRTNPRP